MDAKKELAEIKKMKAEYEKALKERGQDALKKAFKDFFKKNPEVKVILWTQYTPYFNDGDPCYFRVNEVSFGRDADADLPRYGGDDEFEGVISGANYEYVDDPDAKPDRYGYKSKKRVAKTPDPLAEACDEFWETIVDKDLFEAAFGDHARIVATPEGFQVESFDHD